MTRPQKAIVSVGFLLVALLGTVYWWHGSRPSSSKVQPLLLSDVDDMFVDYCAPQKSFLASFPVLPQRASGINDVVKNGQKVGYDLYVATSRLGATYMVNIIAYPQTFDVSSPEKILKSAVEEIRAANPQNVITLSQMGDWFGFPSLDFIVENPLAEIQGKAILKGRTLFVVSVADQNKQMLRKQYEKFISSFTIPSDVEEPQ